MEMQPDKRVKVFKHKLNNPSSHEQNKGGRSNTKTQSQALSRAERKKHSKGPFAMELVFSILLLSSMCALRTVQVYANNTELVSFADLGNSIWLSTLISLTAFALLRIFLRKPYFACVLVAFGTFLAVNFSWLIDAARLIKNEYDFAVVVGLLLYIIIITGFVFLLRMLYKKGLNICIFARILSVTFTCLVIFNIVLASVASGQTDLAEKPEDEIPVVAYKTPAIVKPAAIPSEPDGVKPFGLPNVYFFVLDEYGTFDMMSKYYDYDNKTFYDFLTAQGFSVSRESYGTDNQTANCFTDLLNIEYMSKNISKNERQKAIKNAKLFKIFSDLGYYQYQVANSKYFPGIQSLDIGISQIDSDDEDPNRFGDQAASDVANDSIFGALAELMGGGDSDSKVDADKLNKWGFYPSDYIRETKEFKKHKSKKKADAILKVFDYFENPANYGENSPRVVYAYMLATHVPFVFDEYGGIIAFNDYRNWENKNVYLNQYKFVSKHLMVSLLTIIQNDPESIIIIMSDHGIRHHADCTKKHTFYINNKDSCRIMNAVYIKGEKHNIEGLSGINTLRYILSQYEGQSYPQVEDPINSGSPDNLRGIIPKPR